MKNIKTKIRIAGLSVIVILIFSLSVVNINTVATNSEMLNKYFSFYCFQDICLYFPLI